MTAGILNDVSLGYRLLWNVRRQVAGVTLSLHPGTGRSLDAGHLLTALAEQWSAHAVPLTLTTDSSELLADLLDLAPSALAHIGVPEHLLHTPAIAQRVLRASQRGLRMLWYGDPGARLKPAYASCFAQTVMNLTADEALMCLHLSRIPPKAAGALPQTDAPVQRDQVVEGVANAALANYCLDQQSASALLDWPTDDVLHAYRRSRVQPSQLGVSRLMRLIRTEAPMDDVENALNQEPSLVYRFLRYTNSAGLGLNREITELRHGLMVLGLSRLKTWAQEQRALASHDLNLQPITTQMVLRARFMTELLGDGTHSALARELAMCGLLSQIDLLTGEPLQVALHAIPLPERICAALLDQSGPYWPYLEIAIALENGQPQAARAAGDKHGFDQERINLALLSTLSAQRADSGD